MNIRALPGLAVLACWCPLAMAQDDGFRKMDGVQGWHEQRACPAQDDALYVLVIGQSNSTNYAYHYHAAGSGQASVAFGADCYTLADPWPGGTGGRGSVWSLFADLYAAEHDEPLVILSGGVGGSSVQDWLDKDLLARSRPTIAAQRERIDVIVWLQGESDRKTSARDYERQFDRLLAQLRQEGLSAPVMISQTSRWGSTVADGPRKGQAGIARRHSDVCLGPDTDLVLDRYDAVHFSESGAKATAAAFLAAFRRCGFLD